MLNYLKLTIQRYVSNANLRDKNKIIEIITLTLHFSFLNSLFQFYQIYSQEVY